MPKKTSKHGSFSMMIGAGSSTLFCLLTLYAFVLAFLAFNLPLLPWPWMNMGRKRGGGRCNVRAHTHTDVRVRYARFLLLVPHHYSWGGQKICIVASYIAEIKRQQGTNDLLKLAASIFQLLLLFSWCAAYISTLINILTFMWGGMTQSFESDVLALLRVSCCRPL